MLVLIEMLGWFATVGAISKFLNLVMIGLFCLLSANVRDLSCMVPAASELQARLKMLQWAIVSS